MVYMRKRLYARHKTNSNYIVHGLDPKILDLLPLLWTKAIIAF